MKVAYNNSENIIFKLFDHISNNIEINLCEDQAWQKFCSPLKNYEERERKRVEKALVYTKQT